MNGEVGIKEVGEFDALRFGREPEGLPIPIERPSSSVLLDLETWLGVAVEDLLLDSAGGKLVAHLHPDVAVPFDEQNARRAHR